MPLLLRSVQRTRSTNSYHYREGEGFAIIIINGAANESCRLNNSCATHDLPVPLSLRFFFFSFFLFFPPLFFLFFSVNSASANERKYVVQMRGPETWWHSDCTHRYKSTVCEDKSRCYHAVLSLVRVSPRIVFPHCFLHCCSHLTDFIS